MIARVATFTPLPRDLDDKAVARLRQTVREVPGFVAGFHLLNQPAGKAISITIYEDKEAIEGAARALASRPVDTRVGIEPDTVEFFEATQF